MALKRKKHLEGIFLKRNALSRGATESLIQAFYSESEHLFDLDIRPQEIGLSWEQTARWTTMTDKDDDDNSERVVHVGEPGENCCLFSLGFAVKIQHHDGQGISL